MATICLEVAEALYLKLLIHSSIANSHRPQQTLPGFIVYRSKTQNTKHKIVC